MALLEGVRVLDFTWALAGPLSTRVLADLGAEVIRVETGTHADSARVTGVQPPEGLSLNTSGTFNLSGASKKSVTLNMKLPRARELARELILHSDIVANNFARTDQLDRWGLGYEAMSREKPALVYLTIPAMPREYEGFKAFGQNTVGMTGLAALTGGKGEPPIGVGVAISDFVTAYYGATVMMAALLQREETGRGANIELAQYHVAAAQIDLEYFRMLNDLGSPRRMGNRAPGLVQGVYPCSGDDEWCAITLCSPDDLASFLSLAGSAFTLEWEALLRDQTEFDRMAAAWTAGLTPAEAAAALQRAGIAAFPAQDAADLLSDPGMAGYYQVLEHPDGPAVAVDSQPFTVDGERVPVTRAPLLGEHSESVLRDLLGIGEEEFNLLAAEGVIA